MLAKVAGLARLVAVVLAIVAGLVAIPGLDDATLTTALIVIGLIAGINTTKDQMTGLLIAAITLPAIGNVLGNLPSVGSYLGDIFTNFGMAVAGHAAMGVVLTVYHLVMGDVKGLTGK